MQKTTWKERERKKENFSIISTLEIVHTSGTYLKLCDAEFLQVKLWIETFLLNMLQLIQFYELYA